MSTTTTNVMTIWADKDLQKKFKESWQKFNKDRLGTVTQAEYLEYLIDQIEQLEED